MTRLNRDFFARPTLEVAPELLGKLLVRHREQARQVGRIVEVEAYLGPEDLASHARRGPTPRAAVMFGPPGHAYVYLIYGLHHCLNVVCEPDGTAGAILIRAIEPVSGIDLPTDGPAKLCAALEVDRRLNRADLADGDALWIADSGEPAGEVARGPRVGVEYAGEWAQRPWRFYIAGNRWVSRGASRGRPRDA